jgi:hypothetical protein
LRATSADEQDPHGLVEVDQPPQVAIGQDVGWGAHVVPDDQRVGQALQHVPGVREDHRVVVHLADARRRVGLHRDLVHVALRGQPGADIDELPDARLVHQIANRPPHESAGNARRFTDIRQIGRNLLGGLPVSGIIVLSAEEVIVNARGTRNIRPEYRAAVIAALSLRPVRGRRRAVPGLRILRALRSLGVLGTSPLIGSWLPSPLSPGPLGVLGDLRGSCGH